MLFKKRRKKVIHHSDRRRHFIFVLVSCICLLHSIWNWRQEKYKRRAWQIGLAVQTRTIVIINGCYSINTPLYAAQTATAADYSSRVTGRHTSFIHSFIYSIVMKWQNILLPPAYWNRWPMAQYSCKMSKRCSFSIHSVSTTSPYRFDDYHAVIQRLYDMHFLFCNYLFAQCSISHKPRERERETSIYEWINFDI